jgi:hypothetical protein
MAILLLHEVYTHCLLEHILSSPFRLLLSQSGWVEGLV